MFFWNRKKKKEKEEETNINEEIKTEESVSEEVIDEQEPDSYVDENEISVTEEELKEENDYDEEGVEETEETSGEPEENREESTPDCQEETFENNIEELNEEEAEEADVDLQEETCESSTETQEFTQEEAPKEKKGFFARLIEGLNKTRDSIMGGVDSVLSNFTKIDEDLFEELEEVLIMADLGVSTTETVIENLKDKVKLKRITDPKNIRELLIDEISEILSLRQEDNNANEYPKVILVIGVNGVGKTTTIGKIGNNFKKHGKKVMFAAADTFRAAAIDQLEIWGKRINVDVIKHEENSDPAAVVFDAVNAAKSRKTDVLICDTAGRLHNKKNLMDELKKISKVIDREYPNARKEVLLVLDATTGQNALQQAKLFSEVADISGIVLTKLDGTAKGGIVVAIKSELNIPVKYIGVGEGLEDLQPFSSEEFAKALFTE